MARIVNPQGQPDFNTIDPATFESFCVEIMRAQPGVNAVLLQASRAQLGVDAIVSYSNGRVGAIECKRYEPGGFDARLLRKTCERFRKNIDHWKAHDVSEFRILLSSELAGEALNELLIQRKTLLAVGVQFDVWNGSELYSRAMRADAMDVLERYFPPPVWQEHDVTATFRSLKPYIDTAMLARVDTLNSRLSVYTRERLATARERFRAGKMPDVRDLIDETLSQRADMVPQDVAEWLRLAALVALRDGSRERADQLLGEATALDPLSEGNRRLEAMLAYETAGASGALEMLREAIEKESVHLQAALYLVCDDVEKARAAIGRISPADRNAETHRIQALIAVAAGDLNAAQESVSAGLQLESSYEALQFADGVIEYYRSLVQPPRYIPDYPEPVDWVIVREDNDSRAALARARARLDHLLSNPHAGKQRNMYAIWRLATSANDRTLQDEGTDLASKLFDDGATLPFALAWAASRGWDIVTREATDKAVAQIEEISEANLKAQIVSVLVDVMLAVNDPAQAQRLLTEYRETFDSVEALPHWRVLMARSFLQARDPDAALAFVEDGTSDSTLATLAIRRVIASRTGDYSSVSELVTSMEPSTAAELLECCDSMATAGNWEYVAERAEDLFSSVPNGTGLQLAATALYNTEEMARCVQLLESAGDAGVPDTDYLRRVGAMARSYLGDLRHALEKARELVAEAPNVANSLTLASLEFRIGNRQAVVTIARRLQDHDDLAPIDRLRLAAWVRREDKNLARALWRSALPMLTDDLVPGALSLAYKLEVEGETRDLVQRFSELGQRGEHGVKAMTTEEVRNLVKSLHERLLNVISVYNSGAVGAHMYAEARNRPLSDIYYRQFEAAKESINLATAMPTYLFSASRSTEAMKTPRHIRVDVTALLTASYFDLLSLVESQADQLILPCNIIPTLEAMRDETEPGQPARVKLIDCILEFIAQGKMGTESEPAPEAHVVSFPAEGHTGYTWFDILTFFEKQNIAIEDIRGWRERMGLDEVREVAVLVPNDLLHFQPGVLELAPDPQLLELVIRFFRVSITEDGRRQAESELEEAAQRKAVAERIDGLIHHINKMSIQTNLYRFAEYPHDISQEMDNPLSIGLLSLIQPGLDSDVAIWCDDRFINRWVGTDKGVPIINSLHILAALSQSGVLRQHEYYGRLRELRSANARWIPCSEEEIMYYVERSKAVGGSFVPSDELVELRRYISSVILDSKYLQRPSFTPSGTDTGEYGLIINLRNAITGAICALWKSDRDEGLCEAISSWLYRNLAFDMFAAYALPAVMEGRINIEQVFASSIASFVIHNFANIERKARRRELMTWFDKLVVEPRNGLDPIVIENAAFAVDQSVGHATGEDVDDPTKRAIALFVRDLPPTLRDALPENGTIINAIGAKIVARVGAFGDTFDAADVITAVEGALTTGQASLSNSDDGKNYNVIRRRSDDKFNLVLVDQDGHEERLGDPMYALLDTDAYRPVVEAIYGDCDMSRRDFDELLDSMAQMSRRERVECLIRVRTESASQRYQHVYESIRFRQSVDRNLFFPASLLSLKRHLRMDMLEHAQDYGDYIHAIAKSDGWRKAEAIAFALPIALPRCVEEWWDGLEDSEQRSTIERWAKAAKSPVSAMHMFRLALRDSARPSLQRLASRAAGIILRRGRPWLEAFGAVIGWSHRILKFHAGFESLAHDRCLILAWGHAHEIFRSLSAAGVSMEWIGESFGNPASRSLLVELDRTSRDVSFPGHFSPTRFCVMGLAYAFEGQVEATTSMQQAGIDFAHRKIDDRGLLRFSLLRDASIMDDALHSFLRISVENPESLDGLLGPEVANILKAPNLRTAFHEFLANLQEDSGNPLPWLYASAIVGNSGPYDDAWADTRRLMMTVEFEKLFTENERLVEVVISAILLMISHRTDAADVRTRLRVALVRIASECAQKEQGTLSGQGDTAMWLFQAIINLWVAGGATKDDGVSSLLSDVMYVWPVISGPYRRVLQRMFESERLGDTIGLTNAVLFSRAARENGEADAVAA